MSRWLYALIFVAVTACAETPAQKQEQTKQPPKEEDQAPPDEDQTNEAKVYSFNPVQAQKELGTGEFYYKKGDYRAAAGRFREATKWNPGFAKAWLRLGEATEKQNDHKAAVAAYAKYLEIQPDAKNAAEIRKKLEKLKH